MPALKEPGRNCAEGGKRSLSWKREGHPSHDGTSNLAALDDNGFVKKKI